MSAIEVKNGYLASVAGDSETVSVALCKRGVDPAFWGAQSNLLFTAKLSPDDTDEVAVIQKATGIGITESGAVATIEFVPFDTVEQEDVTLYCDIRAEDIATGARHTGASWVWKLSKPVTKHTDASIPIYTTEPGGVSGNLTTEAVLEVLQGAESDPTKIGAEYMPEGFGGGTAGSIADLFSIPSYANLTAANAAQPIGTIFLNTTSTTLQITTA